LFPQLRLIVSSVETELSAHQREIYHSENGDRWLLSRDDDGRAFIVHKANLSSGGKVTPIELGDFLGAGKAGPEHQALVCLIGSLVESGSSSETRDDLSGSQNAHPRRVANMGRSSAMRGFSYQSRVVGVLRRN
jgi:hypothetical protein